MREILYLIFFIFFLNGCAFNAYQGQVDQLNQSYEAGDIDSTQYTARMNYLQNQQQREYVAYQMMAQNYQRQQEINQYNQNQQLLEQQRMIHPIGINTQSITTNCYNDYPGHVRCQSNANQF